MKQLRIAIDADTDVLEIWNYYFERSQQAAERVVREITSRYDTPGEPLSTRAALVARQRSLPV